MRWFVGPAAILVFASVTLAGCRAPEQGGPGTVTMAGETVARSRLGAVVAGVCDAADLAGRNIANARVIFYAQSHDGLHLIARGLADVDRPAAAALLEAKQKVEADFLAPPPGMQVAKDLRRLAEVTRSGLARFDVGIDPCPISGIAS